MRPENLILGFLYSMAIAWFQDHKNVQDIYNKNHGK